MDSKDDMMNLHKIVKNFNFFQFTGGSNGQLDALYSRGKKNVVFDCCKKCEFSGGLKVLGGICPRQVTTLKDEWV